MNFFKIANTYKIALKFFHVDGSQDSSYLIVHAYLLTQSATITWLATNAVARVCWASVVKEQWTVVSGVGKKPCLLLACFHIQSAVKDDGEVTDFVQRHDLAT